MSTRSILHMYNTEVSFVNVAVVPETVANSPGISVWGESRKMGKDKREPPVGASLL